MFSVGDPRDPRPEDRRFTSRIEAEQHAREQSFPNIVLGVWYGDKLIAIAFDGLLYWP